MVFENGHMKIYKHVLFIPKYRVQRTPSQRLVEMRIAYPFGASTAARLFVPIISFIPHRHSTGQYCILTLQMRSPPWPTSLTKADCEPHEFGPRRL
jgi:hypothetical protein